MPSSALTRWLKQGLVRGMCPLCRVAHKANREYVWHFFEEYAATDSGAGALRAARGFCLEHAEALRRLEVEGLGSTLGISEIYEDAFEGIVDELDALDARRSDVAAAAPCPACANRSEELHRNARYLVELLADDPRSRERYEGSTGLCLPHFALVWTMGDAGRSERSFLLEVQRASARQMLADLREHIRKQGAEAKGEPPGPEQDSWERALHLTAGWPPPAEVVGRPEGEPGQRSPAAGG